MKIRINVSPWDVLLAIEQAADRFLKKFMIEPAVFLVRFVRRPVRIT